MGTEAIVALVTASLNIIERHRAAGGPPITNEEAARMAVSEIQAGESAIAREFAEKGWPLPQ